MCLFVLLTSGKRMTMFNTTLDKIQREKVIDDQDSRIIKKKLLETIF